MVHLLIQVIILVLMLVSRASKILIANELPITVVEDRRLAKNRPPNEFKSSQLNTDFQYLLQSVIIDHINIV